MSADGSGERATLPTAFQAPPPPRVWTLALAFALYLATVVAGTGVTVAIYATLVYGDALPLREGLEAAARSTGGILAAGLVSSLAGIGVALGAAALSPEAIVDRLRLVPARRGVLLSATLTVALLAMGATATSVARLAGVHDRGSLPVIRAALRDLPRPTLALAVLIVGVGAGLGEELFFRGYLLTRLAERWRPWAANALVALLFAAMHLDPVHSSFAMLVGVALGWASLRAKSVRPTVFAHVVNNALSVVGASMDGSDGQLPAAPLLAGGVVTAALALAAAAWLTRDE